MVINKMQGTAVLMENCKWLIINEMQTANTYHIGGQLEGLTGNKAYSYNYVKDVGYDKFGQRTYIKYCNGTETNYTYDAQMRRLQTLQAKNQSVTFMDNAYSYDNVGNILGVANTAPAGSTMGGSMSHEYSYDGLYRLSSAYVVRGEAVSYYQGALGLKAEGRITTLPASYVPRVPGTRVDDQAGLVQRVINHTMGVVTKKFNEYNKKK
ncbi:MAG: hypothetical protein ACK5MG_06685 [Bacteroidales bacterium]